MRGVTRHPIGMRALQHWTENLLVVQTVGGVALLLIGRRVVGPPDAWLHGFYGSLFPLVAVVGGRLAALRRERRQYVGLAWGAFFAFGLTLRAVQTACGANLADLASCMSAPPTGAGPSRASRPPVPRSASPTTTCARSDATRTSTSSPACARAPLGRHVRAVQPRAGEGRGVRRAPLGRTGALRRSGVLALAVAEVVRTRGARPVPRRPPRAVRPAARAGEDLRDPSTSRRARRAGVDTRPGRCGARRASRRCAAHEVDGRSREVWGVPTLLGSERAVFVRLLDRPDGDDGRRLGRAHRRPRRLSRTSRCSTSSSRSTCPVSASAQ
jgi:hypothetical protein